MLERPRAHIQVIGPGDKARKGRVHCRLGLHIKLDHDRIQRSFPNLLSHEDLDLLTLVGAVAFADRTVRRRRSFGWGRDLELSVPVWNRGLWRLPAVHQAVEACLNLLTGDDWRVEFTQLAKARPLQPALQCDRTSFADVACVIPYSGGLDSLAGLQLWQAQNTNSAALRIGTETNRDVGGIIRGSSVDCEATDGVAVKLGLSVRPHPEPTYRTRTFVFFATAALAAKLGGIPRVLIMENGQGALGPSLVPLGDEWPYRSTHPLFTTGLRQLLSFIWENETPLFVHPHLWKTKAEVLREAAGVVDITTWQRTHSCSRRPRQSKGSDAPRSCGLCGGCILRRSALVASGLSAVERGEDFVWKNLRSSSMEAACAFPVSEHDRTIAFTNILNMKHLAETAIDPPGLSVLRVADEVAESMAIGMPRSVAGVQRLVAQHRADWTTYLEQLGRKSWLAELGRPRA